MRPSAGTIAALTILRDPARAAPLFDPERRRLLEALAEQPDSAAGLARRLGESRQRLNYHLRALEDAGLVELDHEGRRGNCIERVLRVAARRFVIDPAVLGRLSGDPADGGDRFSATYLIALASRAIRELAALQDKADRQRKRLATGSVDTEVRLATPAEFEAFMEDVSLAIAQVVAKHHRAGGASRSFRVIAGAYPSARATHHAAKGEES